MSVIEGTRGTPLLQAGAPGDGTSEIQSLDITGSPTGGTFAIEFDGYTTTDIAHDTDAATLELALEALDNTGAGACTVAGTTPNFGITFGANLGFLAVPQFTLADNSLTGGSTPTVVPTTDTPGVTADHRGQPKGALVQDTTNGVLYINAGTALSPTWTIVGTQS